MYRVEYLTDNQAAVFKMRLASGTNTNPLAAAELVMEQTFGKNHDWEFGYLESVRCVGCVEEQPNQFAHMEYGGCLFDYDDSKIDATGLIYPIPDVSIRLNE